MLPNLSSFLLILILSTHWIFQDGADLPFKVFAPLIQNPVSSYYVAPNGSDSNSGTFQAPWKTLQNAANKAPAGSTIYVRAGTYTGFTLKRPNLTFISYPGETAEVTGDGARLSTIKIADIRGASIQNLVLRDNPLQYGSGLNVENASNITITGNIFRGNQGFGLVLKDVSNINVAHNEATQNGGAIEIRYGSDNVIIQNNRIYGNDRVIDSGRAAVGITFYRTTGPIIARSNQLWDNHTLDDVDPAGGAFEVYAASNITMSDNIIWENEMVLETGTDSARTPCDNLTFTRNIAYRIHRQQGMILRCASNSLIAHNTFSGLDKFAFNLSHFRGSYGGSLEGLRIVNNITVNGRAFSIDSVLPASVEIDYNLLYNPGSASVYGKYLAYVSGKGNTSSFTEFQTWTGYEGHGLSVDPKFVNGGSMNFQLTSASPAIDKGLLLGEGYSGRLPDLGRFEYLP